MPLSLSDILAQAAALDVSTERLCAAADVSPSTVSKNLCSPEKVTVRILRKLQGALAEFEAALGAPLLNVRLDELVPRDLAFLDFVLTGDTLALSDELFAKMAERINAQADAVGAGVLWVARVEVQWEPERWVVRPWFWIERGSHARVDAGCFKRITEQQQHVDPWRTDLPTCPKSELVELFVPHAKGLGNRVLGYRSARLGFISSETKKVIKPIAWRPAGIGSPTLDDVFYFAARLEPAQRIAAE